MSSIPTALAQIKGGKLRAIAVTSAKRVRTCRTCRPSRSRAFPASNRDLVRFSREGRHTRADRQAPEHRDRPRVGNAGRAREDRGRGRRGASGTPEQFATLLKDEAASGARSSRNPAQRSTDIMTSSTLGTRSPADAKAATSGKPVIVVTGADLAPQALELLSGFEIVYAGKTPGEDGLVGLCHRHAPGRHHRALRRSRPASWTRRRPSRHLQARQRHRHHRHAAAAGAASRSWRQRAPTPRPWPSTPGADARLREGRLQLDARMHDGHWDKSTHKSLELRGARSASSGSAPSACASRRSARAGHAGHRLRPVCAKLPAT